MHGCGRGRLDSSLRRFVRSWMLHRISSAASKSFAKFDALRHSCWVICQHKSKSYHRDRVCPYQKLAVFLFESRQALLRQVRCVRGGLVQTRACDQTTPLWQDLAKTQVPNIPSVLTKSMVLRNHLLFSSLFVVVA